MFRNGKTRSRSTGLALLLTIASGVIALAASAALDSSATATRTVTVAQSHFDTAPEALPITSTGPGDIYSHRLTLDLPDELNDGDLYSRFDVALTATSTNRCADVTHPDTPIYELVWDEDIEEYVTEIVGWEPYICANPDASIADSHGMNAVLLACPGGTVTGTDGLTGHACSTGDWAVVTNPQPLSFFSTVTIHPHYVGAEAALIAWPGDVLFGPVATFADGQTIELVACLQTPPTAGDDYRGLNGDLAFNWSGTHRPGITRTETRTYHRPDPVAGWTATGCADAITRPADSHQPPSAG